MVRHDFICPNEHIFERLIDTSQPKPWRRRCPECKRMAEFTILPPNVSRNAQRFLPTLIYQNKDGAIINPGRAELLPKRDHEDLLRKGYEVKRLDSFPAYQRAMNQYASHLQRKYEGKREFDAECRTKFQDELRRKYEQTELHKLNPRQREQALKALRRLRELPPDYHKSLRPNVYISAFENDHCSYNDRDTGWKDRRV